MIEKYIQFATNNGYKHKGELENIQRYEKCSSEILTYKFIKKEFIEAIARGIHKEEKDDDWEIIPLSFTELDITIQQAIAIRDNKLEEFITNLLKW